MLLAGLRPAAPLAVVLSRGAEPPGPRVRRLATPTVRWLAAVPRNDSGTRGTSGGLERR